MQEFQRVPGLNCRNQNHVTEGIIAICLNLQCTSKNHLLCFKCMTNEKHRNHVEDCILFYSIPKFLENSLQLIKNIRQTLLPHINSNFKIFEQFIKKKECSLSSLKNSFDDLILVKNNIEQIEFAYNIRSLLNQFVSGCFQIIEKEFLFYAIENSYNVNMDVYLQEANIKAHKLQSLYYYEEAIRCCDQYLSIKIDPNVFCLKARCLNFLDRLDEAEEFFDLAFELKPNDPEIASHTCMLYESKSEAPISPSTYRKHYLMSGNMRKALELKKIINRGQYEEALPQADQCILENSENIIALTLKGFCLLSLKRLQEARSICSKVLRIYPKYFQAIILNAQLLEAENRDDEMYQVIEQNETKFSAPIKLLILTNSYLKLGRYHDAEKLLIDFPDELKGDEKYLMTKANFQLATKQHPNIEKNSQAFNELDQILILGLAKFNAQEYRQALQIFEKGLKKNKYHLKLLRNKILCLLLLGLENEALQTFQIFKQFSPDSNDIQEMENRIFSLSQNNQANIITKKENFDYLIQKANYFAGKKQYDEAIKICRMILAVDPLNNVVKLFEILCFISKNQTDYALNELEDFLKYQPNSLEAKQLKAYILYKIKQYDAALLIYTEIDRIEPNQFIINFSIGNCYFRLKKYNKAEKTYEKLFLKVKEEIPLQGLQTRYLKTMYCLDYQAENFQEKFKEIYQQLKQRLNNRQKDGYQGGFIIWICKNQFSKINQGVALKFKKTDLAFAEGLTKWIISQENKEITQVVHAQILTENNKIEESIQVCDKILQKNPQNLLALVEMTLLYQRLKFNPLIEGYKLKALSIDKNAFDEEYRKKIFVEEMEKEFECDDHMAAINFGTDKEFHYTTKFF